MKTKKKYTPEQRAKMFEPTYVFGYGSLMVPAGINGRKMSALYKQKDLIPCRLEGYERSMCGYFGGRNFYGLLENKKASCNGIVFKVKDWYDYRALLFSEGATAGYRKVRTYWPIRVTKDITGWKAPKGHRVMTLLCKGDKSDFGRVERSYINLCHTAARKWGKEFEADFLETGGIPFNRLRMKAIAKKHNIKLW